MDETLQQTPPNRPIAQVERPQIVPLMDLGSTQATRNTIATNFGEVGPAAAAFITQALAREAKSLDEMGSEVFLTQYYLAHVADLVDERGEVLYLPRVVLIGPELETLAFLSEGAIRSLDLIRSLCGQGPWRPPLPISVVPVTTRRKFRTYRLVLGTFSNGSVETEVHRKRGKQEG